MEEKIMRVAVTGAARGIGAATARLLIQRGWRVACLDRDLDAARQIAGEHPAIAVDVADEELVIGAFAKIREALGGLDALATCAGIFETTPFFETTAKTFRRVHDVNVIGTFLCLREAVGPDAVRRPDLHRRQRRGPARRRASPAPSPMPAARARSWR